MTQQRESLSRIIGDAATENLLSNLNTKIFCANSGATARYASQLIGDHYTNITNVNFGDSAQYHPTDPSGSSSTHSGITRNEQKREYIQASRFQSLRRGGPQNFGQVDTVVYCGGKLFGQGDDEKLPYKMLTFRQNV